MHFEPEFLIRWTATGRMKHEATGLGWSSMMWRTTYQWRNDPTYRDICWIWKCDRLPETLKLYTTMYSIDIKDQLLCSMFKRKLDTCMMNCNEHLKRFSETLTNWHWMSSVKNSCTHGKWLSMTCSNNKVWTLNFVKEFAHLTGMRT